MYIITYCYQRANDVIVIPMLIPLTCDNPNIHTHTYMHTNVVGYLFYSWHWQKEKGGCVLFW